MWEESPPHFGWKLLIIFSLRLEAVLRALSSSWWHSFPFLHTVFSFPFLFNSGMKHCSQENFSARFSDFWTFVFLNMCAILTIFVQQWPLEFQHNFPLLPGALTWPRNTNIWETSGHLHICWYIRSEPLCDVFLTAGVGLGEGCVGFWGAGQNLHLILSSQAI